MYFYRTIVITTLCITISLISCQQQSSNQEKFDSLDWKIAQKDTTELIQKVLNHGQLDSLLSFAFKGKTLKIVKNNIIKQPLKLTMNGKPVEFTEIDSSNSILRIYNNPKFFAKITILKVIKSKARLVIFFESIGLFGEYLLEKNQDGLWKIKDVNFAHT